MQDGSGWQNEKVLKLNLVVSDYHPIRVGKYIPTPTSISMKKAVLNIRNDDTHCFEWSVIAALHSNSLTPEQNPDQVSSYIPCANTLKFKGIDFPMKMEDITKFENQNKLSINVYRIPQEGGQVLPLHITKQRNQDPINILLIEGYESNHSSTTSQTKTLPMKTMILSINCGQNFSSRIWGSYTTYMSRQMSFCWQMYLRVIKNVLWKTMDWTLPISALHQV